MIYRLLYWIAEVLDFVVHYCTLAGWWLSDKLLYSYAIRQAEKFHFEQLSYRLKSAIRRRHGDAFQFSRPGAMDRFRSIDKFNYSKDRPDSRKQIN